MAYSRVNITFTFIFTYSEAFLTYFKQNAQSLLPVLLICIPEDL